MHKTYQSLKEPLRYCKKHTKQVGMLFASCNRHTKTSPFFTWHLAPLVLLWACQGSSDTYRASKKPERPSEALPHDTPKKDGENAWLWPRNDIYYNLRGWERNWESLSSPSLCHWVAGSGGLLNHWRATGKGVTYAGTDTLGWFDSVLEMLFSLDFLLFIWYYYYWTDWETTHEVPMI